MNLMKLFGDEALIEIMEFADVSIGHDDERTTIFVKPFNEVSVTKMQMETVIDFFIDYQIELNLIGDPVFVIEDYPKKVESKGKAI